MLFGYIVINKSELKFREFDVYQSYYCGLCRILKKKYGISGQMTLTYDMTFLLMVLTGLYEPREINETCRCVVHPMGKHSICVNEFTDYAADMNLLMAYYKCCDDWTDEKKVSKAILGRLLKKNCILAGGIYQEKTDKMIEFLRKLYEMEKQADPDLDQMAGCFGLIMAELFEYRKDEWSIPLRKMGFYLGKFIYLMDAYDDIEEDLKNGTYNPLIKYWEAPGFEQRCRKILTMMMTECCRAFELLPIIKNAEILRNILYSGVWARFEKTAERRRKEQDGGKNAGSL